jgi:hypothetical protein
MYTHMCAHTDQPLRSIFLFEDFFSFAHKSILLWFFSLEPAVIFSANEVVPSFEDEMECFSVFIL